MVESSSSAGFWPQFYEPLQSIGRRVANWFSPTSDASNMDDCYEINIELPGVDVDDISLVHNDNRLTVKGEKRANREEKGRNYYFSEREYGYFQRTFHLPNDADCDAIEANFLNGVLTLKIAKHAAPDTDGKRIPIQVG